jgi:hypothetical protein
MYMYMYMHVPAASVLLRCARCSLREVLDGGVALHFEARAQVR